MICAVIDTTSNMIKTIKKLNEDQENIENEIAISDKLYSHAKSGNGTLWRCEWFKNKISGLSRIYFIYYDAYIL